ncbi:hypothetical protein, partial [Xanthomonas translucens]
NKVTIARIIQHLSPLVKILGEVSNRAVFRELDSILERFKTAKNALPELSAALQIGEMAFQRFADAYDSYSTQGRSSSSVAGLLAPASDVARFQHFADAMRESFEVYRDPPYSHDGTTIIQLDGARALVDFSLYIRTIAILADAATDAVAPDDNNPFPAITISGIETGSPVKISLIGDSRAIKLFLSMLRDACGLIYRHATQHGRLVQAMETQQLARQLGINDPETLTELARATNKAASIYARSSTEQNSKLIIDGEEIDNSSPYSQALLNYNPSNHEPLNQFKKDKD